MGLEDGQVAAQIVDANGDPVAVIPDASANKRLAVDAIVTSATPIEAFFRQALKNGGSPDQIVNGSVTPTVFTLPADVTNDIVLTELRLVISGSGFDWNGGTFGNGGGVLTNGVLIELDIGGVVTEITNLKINEDLLLVPVRTDVVVDQVSASGVVALSVDFGSGVTLTAGSADEIRSTVRDDLTTGPRALNFFQMVGFGSKG
jgi:hypothetical protein